MLAFLLIQAAVTGTTPDRIDLLAATEISCAGHEQDIVVCARRNGNRLSRLPDQPERSAIPAATISLPGGGTGAVRTEQATSLQTGQTSTRIMVGTRFPF